MYHKGMEIVEAQERLMDLQISCAPDMKKESRENIQNRLMRAANPVEPVAMTPENLARILNVR